MNRGDYDLAVVRASEAVDEARDLGSERMVHQARAALFGALRRAGRMDEATGVLDAMIAREERRGSSSFPGQTAAFEALLAMDRGELDEAGDLLLEAVRRFVTIPDYEMITWVVQWLLHRGARLLTGRGDPETAARLLGSGDAAIEAKGYTRGADEQREVDATRGIVEAAVEEFEALYEAGRALSPGQALDLVLRKLEGLAPSTPR
jgi:hypothetical protein